MSSISQAKFNVTYSGQHTNDCEDDCSCEDTYASVEGIGALEVLEMYISDYFWVEAIKGTYPLASRRFSVAEILQMVDHIVIETKKGQLRGF